MLTLFFAGEPVSAWPTAARCDTARYSAYFWGLIHRGIYMPCSQFEALFVSAAHGDTEIEVTIAAARQTLGGLSMQ
jgi:glutamate-1-semialdehyde 2,1-aminomutase